MSSRALRRAQKELEERQRLEQLAQEDVDEESEDEPIPTSGNKPSLFAMLGKGEQDDDEDKEAALEDDHDASDHEDAIEAVTPKPKPSKKKKKKKKGKGGKAAASEKPTRSTSNFESGLDEIDRALLSLNLRDTQSKADADSHQLTEQTSEEMQQLFSVLAVDTQHLQPANEMRKLFGRAAVENNNEAEAAGGRRRGRGDPQLGGLAGAVAGRNMPGGRNLASLSLRRNIFVQGKEEWPRASSGGLGMEVVEKHIDGSVEYRFVHNMAYQDVQKQFETCVASMDPNRMIRLLHYNRKCIACQFSSFDLRHH